ncbi:MAG: hypothetical protein AAF202_13175, partial [Pseudomonadota bacterium]
HVPKDPSTSTGLDTEAIDMEIMPTFEFEENGRSLTPVKVLFERTVGGLAEVHYLVEIDPGTMAIRIFDSKIFEPFNANEPGRSIEDRNQNRGLVSLATSLNSSMSLVDQSMIDESDGRFYLSSPVVRELFSIPGWTGEDRTSEGQYDGYAHLVEITRSYHIPGHFEPKPAEQLEREKKVAELSGDTVNPNQLKTFYEMAYMVVSGQGGERFQKAWVLQSDGSLQPIEVPNQWRQ